MKKLLCATTLLSLLTSSAFALTQKVELDMYATHTRGVEVLPLKRMVQRQVAPGAIRGWNVTKIDIKAKSKHGAALASVISGRSESLAKTIPGNPEAFESNISGFHSLTLHPVARHRGARQGRLQLVLDGNVKLDEVKLTMKKPAPYNLLNTQGLLFTSKKSFKAAKLVGSTETILVSPSIRGLQLRAKKSTVTIDKVELVYNNGQKIIIDEMDGRLKKNRAISIALRGPLTAGLRRIKISATTNKVIGSRGKVEIAIAQ